MESALEGTIQEEIERVRITAHLFRFVYGKPLWACKFDEKATDLFDFQNSIAVRLGAAFAPRLHGKHQANLAALSPHTETRDRAKKPKDVQEPQNHGDNHYRIQDPFDGTLHGYVVVNQPKKNSNHDQDHHELNQGHDAPL